MKLKIFLFETEEEKDAILVSQEDYKENLSDLEMTKPNKLPEKDEVLQRVLNDLSEHFKTKNFSLIELLFENQERIEAGAIAQEDITNKILTNLRSKNPQKKYTADIISKGSNDTDITILESDNSIATIESKKVSNFNEFIYFFDKTVSKSQKLEDQKFVSLIKGFYKLNKKNLVAVDLKTPDKPERIDNLDKINNVYDLLSVSKIEAGDPNSFKDCVKFSEIPEELKQQLDSEGSLPYVLPVPVVASSVIRCSHKLVKFEDFLYFEPNSTRNDRVYLQRDEEDKKIYSYLSADIEKVKIDGKDKKIPRLHDGLVRAKKQIVTIAKTGKGPKYARLAGGSGSVLRDCFYSNFKLKPEIQDQEIISNNQNMKKLLFEIIVEKYKDNDYFAVIDNNGVMKIIKIKDKNSLELENIDRFTESNIESVNLRSAGATELEGIRLKFEIKLNYAGFVEI